MIRVREHSNRPTTPATGTWSACAMFSADHTPCTQVHAVNAIIIKREDGS